MSTKPAFLTVQNVSYHYDDGKPILTDINLNVAEREIVALVGSSGIGKSTLLKVLGGLLQPSAGHVSLDGRSPYQSDHSIGIVFQNNSLMPWRTVTENVRLPLEIQAGPDAKADARVREMVALVGLSDAADQYPAQLSGGMAQRVALARALVHQPDVLLLDEPFGALDALTRERMGEELLRVWQAHPVTVLLVTHSIQEAVFLADRVLVLHARETKRDGPAVLSHDIAIPIERPRNFAVQESADFLNCVRAVRHAIS